MKLLFIMFLVSVQLCSAIKYSVVKIEDTSEAKLKVVALTMKKMLGKYIRMNSDQQFSVSYNVKISDVRQEKSAKEGTLVYYNCSIEVVVTHVNTGYKERKATSIEVALDPTYSKRLLSSAIIGIVGTVGGAAVGGAMTGGVGGAIVGSLVGDAVTGSLEGAVDKLILAKAVMKGLIQDDKIIAREQKQLGAYAAKFVNSVAKSCIQEAKEDAKARRVA